MLLNASVLSKFGLALRVPVIKPCAVLECSWKGTADAHTYFRCTMSQAGAACQHGSQRRRNARLGKTKSTGARFTYVTCMFAQLDPAITILVVQSNCCDVFVRAAQLIICTCNSKWETLSNPAQHLHMQAAITVSVRQQSSLQHATA